jgi:hypothetical protein
MAIYTSIQKLYHHRNSLFEIQGAKEQLFRLQQ